MVRMIGRGFSLLVAVLFLSSFVLFSCGDFTPSYPPDSPSDADAAGSSPTITALSISPSTSELDSGGGMISVTVGFTYWDSDMNITKVKTIVDGSEEIESMDLSGETNGSASLTLLLPTTQTGTHSIDVSVLDSRDNESNTLSGTFTVSESGVNITGIDYTPIIADLKISPDSADEGEGGGMVSVRSSIKYLDADSDINTINISYTGTDLADSAGIFGKDSGTLSYTLILDTSKEITYNLSFSVTDSKENTSNILTSIFSVGSPTFASTTSPTTETLYSVWGDVSSSEAFAVGANGTIIHYNGSSWSVMDSGTTETLYGVWGTSANENVFAVGANGTLLYFNGFSWSALDSGTTKTLYSIWGSSATDIYAVGDSGTITHYGGETWSSSTSGTNTLYSVWGSSSTDVFYAGTSGTVLNGGSLMDTYATENLYSIWGTSSTNVFAVGDNGTVIKYTGIWSEIPSITSAKLNSVWGSALNNVYAVGDGGTIVYFNASSWSSMTSPTTSNINSVWGFSAGNIFAVGDGGMILHYKVN